MIISKPGTFLNTTVNSWKLWVLVFILIWTQIFLGLLFSVERELRQLWQSKCWQIMRKKFKPLWLRCQWWWLLEQRSSQDFCTANCVEKESWLCAVLSQLVLDCCHRWWRWCIWWFNNLMIWWFDDLIIWWLDDLMIR